MPAKLNSMRGEILKPQQQLPEARFLDQLRGFLRGEPGALALLLLRILLALLLDLEKENDDAGRAILAGLQTLEIGEEAKWRVGFHHALDTGLLEGLAHSGIRRGI